MDAEGMEKLAGAIAVLRANTARLRHYDEMLDDKRGQLVTAQLDLMTDLSDVGLSQESIMTRPPSRPARIGSEEDDCDDQQKEAEADDPQIHPEFRREPARDELLAAWVGTVLLVNRLGAEPDRSDTDQRHEN